jgi:hypothetical protein
MLLFVGYVRPFDRSASANSFVKHCIRMKSSASVVPVPASDHLLLLKNDTLSISPTNGKILEILRVRNRFVMEENTEHSSGGFRDLSFKVKVGFQVPAADVAAHSKLFPPSNAACRSLRAEHLSLFQCMSSCLHTAAVAAVGLPCISQRWRCRNFWGDPSVKTFVCELQIHHRVSDAARRVMRLLITLPRRSGDASHKCVNWQFP